MDLLFERRDKTSPIRWRGSSPPRPKKFKKESSIRKVMATLVHQDKEGVLLVEFSDHGTIVNTETCSERYKNVGEL